ncbi:MAG: hypothetical protein KDD11_00310 [Acidobacteria bacterium]|nr:hypothetical protein [Acidobacteriota bacterium]
MATPSSRPRRRPWTFALCLAMALAISTSAEVSAQDPLIDSPPPLPQAPAGKEGQKGPRVDGAGALGADPTGEQLVTLDDTLVVHVQGLPAWLGPRSCDDVRLYLNGQPLKLLRASRCDLETEDVTFIMRRIDRAKEAAWQTLLPERDGLTSFADVTLGWADGTRLPTTVRDDQAITFAIADFHVVAFAGAFLAITLIGFLVMAQRSAILRRAVGKRVPVVLRPYSLAKVQVAWWFFLVLSGFLLISILVGDIAPVPSSILAVLGIASGTYLGAEVIDKGKKPTVEVALEEGTVEVTLDKGSVVDVVPEPAPETTRGFLSDLLSDGSGIAFYRFQIFVWTLVLGGFFLNAAWRNLAMPDLPSSLLGLMGISGGTFLGLKLPERDAEG